MSQSVARRFFRYMLPHGVVEFVRCRRELSKVGKSVSVSQFLQVEELVHDAAEAGILLLPPGYGGRIEHVIDVGANVGQWAGAMLRTLAPKTVTFVEPIPKNVARLKEAFGNDPRFRYRQVAVGSQRGMVRFKVTRDTTGASVLPPAESMRGHVQDNWDVLEEIEVPLETIDHLSADLPEVSLLKVDVQGYEMAAFQGAVEALKKTRWVLVELNHIRQYEGGSTLAEIDAFLTSHGFFLCDLARPLRFGQHAVMSDGLYGNINLLPELKR